MGSHPNNQQDTNCKKNPATQIRYYKNAIDFINHNIVAVPPNILILSIACLNSNNAINFDLSLYQPNLDMYQTEDITKDAYILNFWFPSCGPCAKELPHIEKLNNEFGNEVEYVLKKNEILDF